MKIAHPPLVNKDICCERKSTRWREKQRWWAHFAIKPDFGDEIHVKFMPFSEKKKLIFCSLRAAALNTQQFINIGALLLTLNDESQGFNFHHYCAILAGLQIVKIFGTVNH